MEQICDAVHTDWFNITCKRHSFGSLHNLYVPVASDITSAIDITSVGLTQIKAVQMNTPKSKQTKTAVPLSAKPAQMISTLCILDIIEKGILLNQQ